MLTERFEDALVHAARLHAAQKRKGSGVPYVSHLLQVAGIALEHGADEDQAIAALLHDALEDTAATRDEIEQRFGARVADIVESCSDTLDHENKPPWQERKERYIAHVRSASPDAMLVSAADKLHNARSIREDLRRLGDDVWSRFRGGRDGTLWYYRELVTAFEGRAPAALLDELRGVVRELHDLARA